MLAIIIKEFSPEKPPKSFFLRRRRFSKYDSFRGSVGGRKR